MGSLQQYLDMRSQEHASQHKALMDIGQNTASLLASQLKVAEERQILTDLAEKVKNADGTCPNSTRLWINSFSTNPLGPGGSWQPADVRTPPGRGGHFMLPFLHL